MNYSEIYKRIVLRRVELCLTQEKLSELSGIDKAYISKIENGKFQKLSAPTLHKIAKALSVSPSWLLGISENRIEKVL